MRFKRLRRVLCQASIFLFGCRFAPPSFDVLMKAERGQAENRDQICEPRREKMRVMVMVKASKESEAGILPDAKILTEMGKFNEQLLKAGVLLAMEGLQASSKGKRVRFEGPKRTVLDGPFAEAKELVAGFWLWQVRSMEEAVEWLKKAPFDGGAEVEIRRVFETEEFAKNLPPEEVERKHRIRQEVRKNYES